MLDDILGEPAHPEVRRDLPGDLVELLPQVPGQGLAGALVPGEEVEHRKQERLGLPRSGARRDGQAHPVARRPFQRFGLVGVRRVVDDGSQAPGVSRQALEKLLRGIAKIQVGQVPVFLVAGGALDERRPEQHALFFQEGAALPDQGRVADVIGRLDVLAERVLDLGDRLRDSRRLSRHSGPPSLRCRIHNISSRKLVRPRMAPSGTRYEHSAPAVRGTAIPVSCR